MSAKRISPRKRRVLHIILYTMLGAGLVAAGLVAAFVVSAVRDLPTMGTLEPKPEEVSYVYDRDGKVWTELHASEYRVPVELEELPKHFIDAVLAAEDHRFYSHYGVDLRAIVRAFFSNLTGGGSMQGGSTITQQLAKKAFLTDSRTWTRKVQDAVLAILLERQYTKTEILEMYLNQVPFGRGAYGPEAAARIFFGKSIKDVTLEESAMLAGLLKGPAIFDPIDNPNDALARRNTVLEQMTAYGYITRDECEEAKSKPINAVSVRPETTTRGGYFLDYVLKQLLSRYPADLVYSGGLRVYTTYSPQAQEAAENAVAKVLDKDFPYEGKDSLQAACVVLDSKTGHILAIVGGRKHEGMLGWNRAIDAKRQPGSSFKPIAAYVPAIEAGMGPGTVVDDSPVTWVDPVTGERFSPRNYSGTFQGPMTLRKAVRESVNVVAAKVQDMVGTDQSLAMAMRMGITSLVTQPTSDGRSDHTRSLALGGLTYGVSPLDMAVAYGCLSNRGIRVDPICILRVEDKNGSILEEHQSKRTLVMSEETAYLMTSMLEGALTESGGTGGAAYIGRPCAGKTGTTSNWKDAWFCGYTPSCVGVVWIGFDQEKTMEQWKITGGSYPARIWREMMTVITEKQAPEPFKRPDTIVTASICNMSGLSPGPGCPEENIVLELFKKERVPNSPCTYHITEHGDHDNGYDYEHDWDYDYDHDADRDAMSTTTQEVTH
ncbi:MAG: transglycosylase domain-containing protein [Bacillota bacterium]|jgi:penicillin-binding protein 1A